MYNVLVAVRLWAPLFSNEVVCVRCDRQSVVVSCNSGKTRDRFLNMCFQDIWCTGSIFNIDTIISHKPDKQNILPDTRCILYIEHSTRAQYHRQFKLYLIFLFSQDLKKFDSVTAAVLFLVLLASNSLYFIVLFNYLSALKHILQTIYRM